MSVLCRPDPGPAAEEPPGHDFACASCLPLRSRRGPSSRHRSLSMSRYVAPLGFTLAAVWVAVLFVLAGGGH
ncbi:hypothetical protein U2F26_15130 [Micromonospora sp. 4G57]|uniref:Uncharacterized protein n=1 Tax=Micromonospora sicca TaxID=2202420 RepID=A0ABU5JLH9_9ACTN|nr:MULTISPECIES: hypothetical protein [unclassified Micromonospora]MDZ5444057.1 hypothetical protein [Micromonospora sp. 4G57]MDZ5493278.1 hypothetical protein [Micromonospora sp. 4G53]